ncbi:hypothetical protein D9M70_426800 [compost metagenome]
MDQACFLAPGNHLDRVAEHRFGAADEVAAVARFAQRVGADHAHRALGHAVDQLGETAQAIEAALHGVFAEQALLVDAGGQLHLLPEPLQDADLAVIGLGQDDVEAVRAQIDGGDEGEVLDGALRHGLGLDAEPRHPAMIGQQRQREARYGRTDEQVDSAHGGAGGRAGLRVILRPSYDRPVMLAAGAGSALYP